MRSITALLTGLLLSLPAAAPACTVCASETGQQVRSELADEHLGVSLLATAVPFAVVLGVVACVHFYPQRTTKHDDA